MQTHGRARETSIHARHARTGQVGQQSVRKTSNLTFGPLRRIQRRILSTRRFGFSAAVLGTMFLGGDLWFESFAVPWLAEGPFPQVVSSDPSILFALGAISSYLLFAIGGVSFGVASLRARVFPGVDLVFIVIGGIVGYQALLSPCGIPLGVAIAPTWWLDAARSFRGHHGSKRWSS